MNLHGLVRGVIGTVNPDIAVDLFVSTGYGQNASFKQVPQYAAKQTVQAQVQALTAKDLRHEALQNLEGVKRAVYLYGNIQGLVRPDGKGGDLLFYPQVPGGTKQCWKTVCVLETWPDWCKVAVVLQLNQAPPS